MGELPRSNVCIRLIPGRNFETETPRTRQCDANSQVDGLPRLVISGPADTHRTRATVQGKAVVTADGAIGISRASGTPVGCAAGKGGRCKNDNGDEQYKDPEMPGSGRFVLHGGLGVVTG